MIWAPAERGGRFSDAVSIISPVVFVFFLKSGLNGPWDICIFFADVPDMGNYHILLPGYNGLTGYEKKIFKMAAALTHID